MSLCLGERESGVEGRGERSGKGKSNNGLKHLLIDVDQKAAYDFRIVFVEFLFFV